MESSLPTSPAIEIEGLGFHFRTRSVFLGLDLHLQAGLTWLRGRNGRGKTTLLKLLGGALVPAGGSIRLDGLDSRRDAPAYRRLSFYCGFDAPALDWLTVSEWLDLHLSLYPGADAGAVAARLDAFRIADIAAQPVAGLSPGQFKSCSWRWPWRCRCGRCWSTNPSTAWTRTRFKRWKPCWPNARRDATPASC